MTYWVKQMDFNMGGPSLISAVKHVSNGCSLGSCWIITCNVLDKCRITESHHSN